MRLQDVFRTLVTVSSEGGRTTHNGTAAVNSLRMHQTLRVGTRRHCAGAAPARDLITVKRLLVATKMTLFPRRHSSCRQEKTKRQKLAVGKTGAVNVCTDVGIVEAHEKNLQDKYPMMLHSRTINYFVVN